MREPGVDLGAARESPGDFLIGDCLVQPQVNRLRIGERRVQLEPKAMEVLLCLARRPGQVLARRELLELAWRDTWVTDDALTQTIVQLRRALEDSAERPRYIETIRKKGYRLVAPVSGLPAAAPGDAASATEPRRRQVPRVGIAAATAAAVVLLVVAGSRLVPRDLPDVGDGLTAVPMTTWPGLEGYAAPSPDGSRVVFSASKPGDPRYDLFMKQPGSDTTIQLTDKPGHVVSPTWSPDGRFIAFARRGPGGCQVLQIPALGGPETLLRPCGERSVPLMDWSPDGKTLAISTWPELGGSYRIELYDFASGESEVVTDPPAGYDGDRFPDFHPDGRSIAFRRTRAYGVGLIYRLHLDSGELERITPEPGFVRGLSWTPDGTGLVIGRQSLGVYQLAWISADGKRVKPLPLGTEAYFPIFGASGLLAFVTRENRTNFWQLELGEGPEPVWHPFAHSSRTDWAPAFSPSGDRIAFASDRNGAPGLWIGSRTGEQLEELISFGEAFLTHPDWSPDGERLAFEVRIGGGSHIHLLEIGSETSVPLTSGDHLNTTPTWSRDGTRIYFGSDRTGSFEIWAAEPEGDANGPRQVTFAGGYLAMESPDGEWLYYSKRRPSGLFRQPIGGGEEERVVPAEVNVLAEPWTLGDGGVYYFRTFPRELFHLDLASGVSRSLGRVLATRYGSIALDPWGEKLIVQTNEWVGADIYTAQWPRR